MQVIQQSTGLDLGWQDDPCSPFPWEHIDCEGNLVTSLCVKNSLNSFIVLQRLSCNPNIYPKLITILIAIEFFQDSLRHKLEIDQSNIRRLVGS